MGTGAADSWYHEKESAWLYGVVAAAEPDPAKRALFVKLAAAAEDQAARWLGHARPSTIKPVFTPALRARIVARLVRTLGPRRLRRVLAAMKLRGLSVYSRPARARRHMPCRPPSAEVGKRHASAAAAIFAPRCSARATAWFRTPRWSWAWRPRVPTFIRVQIAGAAGLLAGALSMAAGEYVSVRSQREFYEHQMDARAQGTRRISGSRGRRARAHLQRARHRHGRGAPHQRRAAVASANRRSTCWRAKSWA